VHRLVAKLVFVCLPPPPPRPMPCRYLREKDHFERQYKKHLSKRLLATKPPNEGAAGCVCQLPFGVQCVVCGGVVLPVTLGLRLPSMHSHAARAASHCTAKVFRAAQLPVDDMKVTLFCAVLGAVLCACCHRS
jgi:hypothetical protein